MRNIIFGALIAALSFALAACHWFEYSDPIAIKGTVVLTLNGEPLDQGNYPLSEYGRYSPAPPAPINISVYSTDGSWIDSARVSLRKDNADGSKGTHEWTALIPEDQLPGDFEFRLTTQIRDVAFGLDVTRWQKVRVEKNGAVDLGSVDYEVARLYGNLPVTIGGRPAVGRIYLSLTLVPGDKDNYYPAGLAEISPNGDWSFSMYRRYLNERIEFSVNERGFPRVSLDPYVFSESEAGIEVVFPGFPEGVDL